MPDSCFGDIRLAADKAAVDRVLVQEVHLQQDFDMAVYKTNWAQQYSAGFDIYIDYRNPVEHAHWGFAAE